MTCGRGRLRKCLAETRVEGRFLVAVVEGLMLGTTRRRRIRLSRMRPRRTSLVTRLEMGCRPLKCQMQGRCCVMLSSVVQLDGRSCSSRKGLFVDIVRMMVCCSSFMSAHSYRSFECMVMSKTDSLLHLTFATEHRSQLSFNRGAFLCRSGILSRNLQECIPINSIRPSTSFK